MKKTVKQLILLYLLIVLLKISLTYFIPAPVAFSDDYGFAKVARNFFYYHTLASDGGVITVRPSLYPITLSPAYVFMDMEIVFLLMKVLNALMSSLIIFPAWLLSKEFFNERKSMLLTIMISVLPSHFCFTYFLMAENLFYPLFLLSVYFVYKSFTNEKYKWDILSGIFIGLTYLTKITGLILPIVVFFIFLFKMFKRDYKEINKKLVMAFFFLITILPWLIRNALILGFNKNILLGTYGRVLDGAINSLGWDFLLIFSTWFILNLGYLIISSGFIFFVANFFTFKTFNNKILIFSFLTFSSTLLLICLASRTFKLGVIINKTIFPWLTGRIIGRYIEVVLPLIFINGVIGIKYLKKISKIYIIPIAILIFSSQLVFFQLFPVNNMSLAWLGALKFILDFLIYGKTNFESMFTYGYSILFTVIFLGILFLMTYLWSNLNVKKILCLLIIFFFLVSLLNFIMIYYNSYTFWYKSEQTQLGLWFNKYDPKISNVLFDERDGCKISKTNQTCIYNPITGGGMASVMGFWMNDKLLVGSVDKLEGIDYVISRHNLDLSLLKKTENGIFLYKVDKAK